MQGKFPLLTKSLLSETIQTGVKANSKQIICEIKVFLCVTVICLAKYVPLGKKIRNNQTDFSSCIFTLKPYGNTIIVIRNR